ncbi:MAG: hypothetical protein JWM49_2707 [Microbacteriaceae bacterium]|nr:hypothetical protein [Microbacteriaceae bacterium]
MGMSTILEHQYRRTLRWYPSSWRAQHEEAVIGTLLDVAEGENRSRPRLSEQLNLAVNGLLTRIGIFLPARVRDGVAAVALATGTAFATSFFVFLEWSPWTAADRVAELPLDPGFGPFVNPGVIVCALWALGFLFAVLGRYQITRVLMVMAILVAVAIPVVSHLPFAGWVGPSSTNLGFFELLGALSLVGTPPSRVRLGIGTGIAMAVLVAIYKHDGAFRPYYSGDHFFWWLMDTRINLDLLLVPTFLVAIGFGLAGRGTTAAVIAISTLPWAAAYLVVLAVTDPVQAIFCAAWLTAGLSVVSIAVLKRSGFEIVVRRRDDSR